MQSKQGDESRKRRRRLWIALEALTAIYTLLLLAIFFGPLVDLIVIFPNHRVFGPQGAERMAIAVGDGTLEAWRARSPAAQSQAPQAFVLRFVGQGDRAERWVMVTARLWGNRPVEVWAMNYPGSGGSSGPARLDRICPLALALYDELKKTAGERPIFVQGHSLGTTVALHLGCRRPVAGMVLHNPCPLRQVIVGHHGWWNLWLLAVPASTQIPAELDAVANAARTVIPAVFILSERDSVIPPRLQKLVVDAYQDAHREVNVLGARHNDPLTSEANRELLEDIDWLWQSAVPADNGQ